MGCLTSKSRSNVRDLPLVQDRYISLSYVLVHVHTIIAQGEVPYVLPEA